MMVSPSSSLSAYDRTQVPLAYGTFIMALITVAWKTVGLSIIPGFDEVWGVEGDQYPRRASQKDAEWQLFYLCMYGGIGVMAQYSGLQFSLSTRHAQNNDAVSAQNVNRARMLGFFHVVIGLHHSAWCLTRGNWGRLDLKQFDLPLGGYLPFGLVSTLTLWHGIQLLLTKSSSDDNETVIRHKVLVDATSLMTLLELVGFIPANWFGYRNAFFESFMWMITIIAPLVMYALDGLHYQERSKHTVSSSDDARKDK